MTARIIGIIPGYEPPPDGETSVPIDGDEDWLSTIGDEPPEPSLES